MDPVIGGIIIAVIAALSSPAWVGIYRKWQETHNPSRGWEVGIATLTAQVADLRGEVSAMRLEIRELEEANSVKERNIAERDRVIGEQSRALIARDARIGQLVHAWPTPPVPSPDPAYANDLGRKGS